MQKGWKAKGLLKPLWQTYPGKRDGLAVAVGSTGGNLSGINSGRLRLGRDLGQRLADELGVSLLELGAPLEAVDARGLTLVSRLEALADQVAESVERQAKLHRQVSRLQARVRRLEVRAVPGRDAPTGRASEA